MESATKNQAEISVIDPSVAAAIWLRHDSDDQGRIRLRFADEEKLCRTKAEREGLQVAWVFKVFAGGHHLDIPELNELRGLVRNGLVSAIVTPDLSRLTHNTTNLQILNQEASDAGVCILALDATDKTMVYLRSLLNRERNPETGFKIAG